MSIEHIRVYKCHTYKGSSIEKEKGFQVKILEKLSGKYEPLPHLIPQTKINLKAIIYVNIKANLLKLLGG